VVDMLGRVDHVDDSMRQVLWWSRVRQWKPMW
jgi:hypothetical protein